MTHEPKTVELKVFVPAKDYARSRQFYVDLGFHFASDDDGVAYLHCGETAFLLQDFHDEGLAKNLMLHLLVEDVDAWHAHVLASGVRERYGVRVGEVETQPWRMRDFVLFDPSGVLWRIAQNIR